MTLYKITMLILAVLLVGCGKGEPTKTAEPKPEEKKEPAAAPGITYTQSGGGTPKPPSTPGPSLLEPNSEVQKLAERFIADLRAASDKPDPLPDDLLKRISPAFLKVIGKPLLTDADKKLGYSEGAASNWLRRTGTQLAGIGPPMGYGSPTAAVLVGSFGNGAGRILIRMVFAEGWKVDWVSLGSIKAPSQNPTSTEGSYQDFAVLAFLDALTGNAASKEDRVLLLGGVISAQMKNAWAEPFEGDKTRGFDFNATKLGLKLDEIGAGVTGFSRTSEGGDTNKIELAKGEAKAAYTLKLVKGATPGEWLVEAFSKP